jgi:hypothetical protein
MAIKAFNQSVVSLTANLEYRHQLKDTMANVVVIVNPSGSEILIASDSGLSATNFEARALSKDRGLIFRLKPLGTIFLLCSANVDNIIIQEYQEDSPLLLMFMQSITGSVAVSSIPALSAGTNTIGKINQGDPAVDAKAWPFKLIESSIALEKAEIKGTATGGSPTTIVDSALNLETNVLANKLAKVLINAILYVRKITANTADTITIPAIQAAVAAGAVIGEASGGQVTIACAVAGAAGNDYTVEFVNGSGNNVPLSAALNGTVLTVTLATNGSGLPDDSANTGTAVAAAIDALAEFTSTMTGAGGVVAATTEPVPFTGGVDAIAVVADTPYSIY